jgi:thioester reductase-like protein
MVDFPHVEKSVRVVNYLSMSRNESSFITGFPGFIAGRLLSRLATNYRRFSLLVQHQFLESAKERVAEIVEKAGVSETHFTLISGDISLPDLGMPDEIRSALIEETTDVFHLAAIYDLGVDKQLAHTVNVLGTRNINQFCMSLPRLRRYNYVSTCYVAGKRTGKILETELEHNEGFKNHYEETKYLAEVDVESLKKDLPVTIIRPSVVIGDSKTGETSKYDGIYSLIHYLRKAPKLFRLLNVGNYKVRLNLVPVDYVVDGLVTLAEDDRAVGKTVALADPDPLFTAELFDVLAREMSGKTSVMRPPSWLVERSLMLPFSPALTGLPHSGVPYFFISQHYDTSVADELLKRSGVKCPRFNDYARNIIDFVEKHPVL